MNFSSLQGNPYKVCAPLYCFPIWRKMINISIMKSLRSSSVIMQLNLVYCIIKLQATEIELELGMHVLNYMFSSLIFHLQIIIEQNFVVLSFRWFGSSYLCHLHNASPKLRCHCRRRTERVRWRATWKLRKCWYKVMKSTSWCIWLFTSDAWTISTNSVVVVVGLVFAAELNVTRSSYLHASE